MLYHTDFLSRLGQGLKDLSPVWGVSPDATLTLLTISENATFRIADETTGSDLIVRVHRPDYHTQAEILSELAWIDALRQDGVVVTPRPVTANDGSLLQVFSDGETMRHAVAFEYMAGKEPDAESDLVHWYRTLGEINAKLHAHSRIWTRPENFVRKTWSFNRILGDGAYWGDWRDALGLKLGGKSVLERTHKLLEAQTSAYGYGEDRFGLVHCDMRAANLLVDNGRLGVIDFDDCGLSWYAYDFAASISFMEHEPFIPDLKAAWLEGYRRVTALDEQHEAALPMFIMLRRMQLTAWIASHAETPTAQSMGTGYTDGTVALAERYLAEHR
ncbi:phosphotransferase enzyme family protein [Agrobacterium pusense]|uniref:phosphotransferase enzyme family protein n=1 Tax=Agrobacterium pusense TaxID=648995 RepID=UPI0005C86EE4|nr:phosphotransferase enzyme family protein [Agrobacterium pusense]MCZ7927031.1 phosphotransferase enzyme family protein [Agrobacterium pusense]MDP9772327.1 Ser/Thr protein kinase RdoA (MazF antagonist) [Rhizobium sp. SORGH_AS_0755]